MDYLLKIKIKKSKRSFLDKKFFAQSSIKKTINFLLKNSKKPQIKSTPKSAKYFPIYII